MCQATTEGRALDVIEIDAASNRGIDEIRELNERVKYAPNQAGYKVYIIDEVHMLTKEASNALLKTLEEPPASVIFVLATTEAHKILPTIMSRCQRFDFHRISQKDIAQKLDIICRSEDINMEAEAVMLVARSAAGSLRDAENLLEQLFTYYGSDVKLEQVRAVLGLIGDERAKELAGQIVAGDITGGMRTINAASSDGLDLNQFNRELVSYLRALLLIKSGCEEGLELTIEEAVEFKGLAAAASMERIITAVKLFGQLRPGVNSHATLPLELALVDCGQPVTAEVEEIPAARAREPAKSVDSELPPVAPSRQKQTVKQKQAPTTPKVEIITPRAEAATAPLADSGSKLEQLKSNWKQVIEQAPEEIKRSPAVAILRSAGVKPIALDGDTVTLAFRYPYHKEKIEEKENKKVVSGVISTFIGRTCKVHCVYEPEENHLLREAQRLGGQIVGMEEK
jgi:DNA polymerase-3 subunit gamma/tau